MKYSETECAFICETCGQILGVDVVRMGHTEGWAYCPGCGSECQEGYDNFESLITSQPMGKKQNRGLGAMFVMRDGITEI